MNLSLARDVTLTEIDHGAVLLDGRHGRYWQLNITGAAVLQQLLAGESLTTVVTGLAAGTTTDASRAQKDVTALVDALESAHLVEVRS